MILKKTHFARLISALLVLQLCISISPASLAQSVEFDEHQISELKLEPLETPTAPAKLNIIPENPIDITTFDGILLDAPIPNILYKNETYTISGKVTSNPKNERSLFAFLSYQDINNKEQFINFEGTITNNAFHIPLRLEQTGNYQLGIVLGNGGKSKVREITAIETSNNTKGIAKSTTIKNRISLSYNDATDTTALKWKRITNNMHRITFQQQNTKVIYITRQPISTLPLRYTDFKNFKPGEVTITIATRPLTSSAITPWKNSTTQKVKITYHGFRNIENNVVTLQEQPTAMKPSGSTITIQGTANQPLDADAYITLPSGITEKITLQSEDPIPANKPFILTYQTKDTGRYIVEINETTGAAVINMPIYITTGTPLIPDYQDLINAFTPKAQTISLQKDRATMLTMINAIRTSLGLSAVSLNTQLSALAQEHSNDMVAKNYFGHVNLEGKSPEDRRKKAQYPAEVGENLANSSTLASAMQGLLRSPIHRANILTPHWTQVGIGIAKSSDGSLKVTQEFSGEILTSSKLGELRQQLISGINAERNKASTSAILEDEQLTNVATNWSEKLAVNDEFGFTTADGQNLTNMVRGANIKSAIQMFVFSSNTTKDLIERVAKPSNSIQSEWTRIGIGLAVTMLGEIKITTLLSK